MRKPKKQLVLDAAALDDPSPDNPRCQACGLWRKTHDPFRKWEERETGSTAIISPTPLDIQTDLWYDIRKLIFGDLDGDDVALFEATLCHPYDKKVSAAQFRHCKMFLTRLLTDLNPQRILVMGGKAVQQVWPDSMKVPPIKDLIGQTLTWNDTPLYVTYDPASSVLGKPEFLITIRNHVRRMMYGLTRVLPAFPGYKKVASVPLH